MAFTAIINNMDWAHVDFLNEFTGALREREQADGGAALTAIVSIGDDVQLAALWASWQQACEDLADVGVWCENKSYDEDPAATIPVFTWATVLAAASMPTGFRRATTMPADWTDYNDPAFLYGQCQAGDIIGPWLFADLQAILKELTATKPGGITSHEPVVYCYEGQGVAVAPNCAAFKLIIEGIWAPCAVVDCECISLLQQGPIAWTGALIKRKQGAEILGGTLWNGVDRSLDWYVFTDKPEAVPASTYDDNGEALHEDQWALWAGAGVPENTADPTSLWCPLADIDAPFPIWPDCPVPGDFTKYTRGWKRKAFTGFECVVRWNVAGGFTYV